MRLAVLFSGGASTACTVANAITGGVLARLEISIAISSNPKASGIEKLRDLGVKVEILNPKNFSSPELFGHALLEILNTNKVDTIAQLGWLAKTPVEVIKQYQGRIINQHPGPLDPEQPHQDFGGQGMYGARVHAARLHFAKHTGAHNAWTEATVHHVTENYDEGEVVGRTRVEIPGEIFNADISSPTELAEKAEALQKLVLPEEYKLVIETLAKLASGSLTALKREQPLIANSELAQLKRSKQVAVEAYQAQRSNPLRNHTMR